MSAPIRPIPPIRPHPETYHPPRTTAPTKVGELQPIQLEALELHERDLRETLAEQYSYGGHGRLGLLQLASRSPTAALIRVILMAIGTQLAAFMSNPTLIISSPIDWGYSLLAFWVLTEFLVCFDIGLFLFGKFGGYELVSYISKKHGKNMSIVNLGDPDMFTDESTLAINYEASKILASTMTVPNGPGTTSNKLRTPTLGGTRVVKFNLDVAKMLLLLSALVYERKEAIVTDAVKISKWAKERLLDSEKIIHKIAASYNLKFCSISDFTSVSGSYAGAFWSDSGDPFIVIAMKGTTPSNYEEFLIDTTIVHEDASTFLFGACHQGFYSALFPSQSSNTRVSPYRRITGMIKRIAKEIRGRNGMNSAPVPLWITGHSLGGALAALLYTRYLLEPDDLGIDVELRDGFVYGCPRLGDATFCGGFEKLMEKDDNIDRTLWRVCNESDIVAKVPPGLADIEELRLFLNPASILNYGFIGTAVHLDRSAPYFYKAANLRVGDLLEITESEIGGQIHRNSEDGDGSSDGHNSDSSIPKKPSKEEYNIIEVASLLMRIFLPFLRDHFPSVYFANLSKIKGYEHSQSSLPSAVLDSPQQLRGLRGDGLMGRSISTTTTNDPSGVVNQTHDANTDRGFVQGAFRVGEGAAKNANIGDQRENRT